MQRFLLQASCQGDISLHAYNVEQRMAHALDGACAHTRHLAQLWTVIMFDERHCCALWEAHNVTQPRLAQPEAATSIPDTKYVRQRAMLHSTLSGAACK